jgi:hypothetical protein
MPRVRSHLPNARLCHNLHAGVGVAGAKGKRGAGAGRGAKAREGNTGEHPAAAGEVQGRPERRNTTGAKRRVPGHGRKSDGRVDRRGGGRKVRVRVCPEVHPRKPQCSDDPDGSPAPPKRTRTLSALTVTKAKASTTVRQAAAAAPAGGAMTRLVQPREPGARDRPARVENSHEPPPPNMMWL